MTVKPVKGTVHTEHFLPKSESSRKYQVRDFLCISKTVPAEASIVACDLYYIPSQDAWYHEFLLVYVDMGGERLMLIVERNPSNEDMRVIFLNGGVAQDTITVVRAWYIVFLIPKCRVSH